MTKVIPQLKRAERLTADQLSEIHVTGPEGKLVPLSTFATLRTSTQPRELKRFQQRSRLGRKVGLGAADRLQVLAR